MLGVLLAGIVAMQVEVLKMSASVGRSLAYSSQLQSQNEQLRASVASLGDDQRIMRVAYGMGMVMPHSGMVGFLSGLPQGSLQAAAGNIRAPDAATFLNSTPIYPTPKNGQVVTASSLALGTTGGGASPVTTGTTGQSASGPSSAGANSTQSPALVQSPASASGTQGSNTGGGSNSGGGGSTTGGGGGSNTGTGTTVGGTGTGTTVGGTGTGTTNGGGSSSGGGASLTGGTGTQLGGGTQTTPSGG